MIKFLNPKDTWEENYIKNLRNANLLAWDDSEAFYRYPKYSHIYDKFLLSKLTGNSRVWDLEALIDLNSIKYPVFVKPKMNLFGLGKDSYAAFSFDEIEDTNGMIAQELFKGTHYSTDYVLHNGKVIDSFTFIGHKNFYNDFILWESNPFPDKIKNKVEDVLPDYTGIANFESIDGHIIEGHLRGSLQFFDICGDLLGQMPAYYKDGSYNKVKFIKSYSKVLRTRRDGYLKVKSLPKKLPNITSIQLTYDPSVKLSTTDPSGFKKRYCVINGTCLSEINNYATLLKDRIFIGDNP